MQHIPNQSLFRSFSANDWNQVEHQFLTQFFKIFNIFSLSTFSSNAEKMRKSESFYIILLLLSLDGMLMRIGFIILFPFIQKCFSFTIRVVS